MTELPSDRHLSAVPDRVYTLGEKLSDFMEGIASGEVREAMGYVPEIVWHVGGFVVGKLSVAARITKNLIVGPPAENIHDSE